MGICEIHYDKKEGGIKRQVAPPGRLWKSRGPSSPSWSQASHRFCPKSPLRLAQHSGKSPLSKLEKSDPTLRTKHSCESLPGEATRMVHGKGFLWQLQRTTMVQHRARKPRLYKLQLFIRVQGEPESLQKNKGVLQGRSISISL